MAKSGDEGIRNKFFCDLKCLFPQKPEVDDGLVRDFQNVGLKSNQTDTSSGDSKELRSDGDVRIGNPNMQNSTRSYAEDCSFFIRTGTCKFGLTCKFNHPVRKTNLVDLGKSHGNDVSSAKNLSHIPCKFYPTGRCYYGESCRFSHSKSEADKSSLQLNVLGYPKTLDKISCSFYMRTGMCGYGASCRFNHPEPIFVFEPELCTSIPTGESMDNHKEASEITDAGYVTSFSEPTHSYLSLPLMIPGRFMCMHQNRVLCGYQAPECTQEVRFSSAPPAANVETIEANPEDPPKREPCVLNDVGSPIRPGKKVCWNYKNLGLCKMGRACAYDHPKKQSSTDASTTHSHK